MILERIVVNSRKCLRNLRNRLTEVNHHEESLVLQDVGVLRHHSTELALGLRRRRPRPVHFHQHLRYYWTRLLEPAAPRLSPTNPFVPWEMASVFYTLVQHVYSS